VRRARSVVTSLRLIGPPGLRRGAAALGAAALLQSLAGTAQATAVYTVQVTQNVDLGVVTSAASGDTVFRVDPTTGAVTTVSGTATRAGGGTTRAMVTVSCAASAAGDCTNTVNIRIGSAGAPTGRARALTRITFIAGTAQLSGGPGPPGSGSFTIAPIGPNASKTFFVGADLGIAADDSGLATGPAEADFFAFAAESPGTPTSGDVGRFQAVIIRSIAIAKLSDLVFGRIVKPLAGSGAVTINANSGARTFSGAQGLDSPTPGRASFNVTGEGGQTFSVSVPATFDMTGPQTMTVTTTSSVGGTAMLSSTLGSAGSFTIGVGGSAPINASTLSGDYSGSFIVTVAYN
jgi:hypothetical protein